MANAMITGVSGLQVHQKMIEVVGNNLANLNTVGYKQQSAIFADVLYETLRGGTSGTTGVSGGTDPVQVGTGAKLSSIRSNMTGGGLESTGNDLDLALDGNGFFVVNDGSQNLYTRAGAFQIDKNGMLTDSGTGYPVQRFGTVGESNEDYPSFQTAGNSNINIPIGANVPGRATQNVTINGNLPSSGTGPVEQILQTPAWLNGATPATSSTLLNSLGFVTTPYQAGDTISISGTNADGAAVSSTFNVTATTTVGNLLTAINNTFPDATATLGADGKISLTANDTGKSFLSLTMANGATNVGTGDLSSGGFVVSQAGSDGTTVSSGVQVYDVNGAIHTVNYNFSKNTDGTWGLNVTLDSNLGTVIDGQVSSITFNPDGSFKNIGGTGIGDGKISIQFTGQTEPTTFNIVLDGGGVAGAGISSHSGAESVSSKQDGYANGTLTSVQVDSSGLVMGIGSNGATFPVAQLAIGSFRNPQGLQSAGNNFYTTSLSSGDVQLGAGGSNGNGLVRSGQLEQSNVDIAVEFTRLIIAQRGFSANSRTITVTNDILQELTSLIR